MNSAAACSMIKKFRSEFEDHIEMRRRENEALLTAEAPPEPVIQGAAV